MMHSRLFTLAFVLLTLGCAQLSSGNNPHDSTNTVTVFDHRLDASSLALPPLVSRAHGIEIRSCQDLISTLRAGKELGEISEFREFNAYTRCIAVALIQAGGAAPDTGFDSLQAGERIYRDLDLASVASSLAPRRPAEHYRLRDLPFDSVQIAPRSVTLRGNGFVYTFETLALGDFRGLRKTELLVRFSDRAVNGGTYDKQSLLVIDASSPGKGLLATDALDVLKDLVKAR